MAIKIQKAKFYDIDGIAEKIANVVREYADKAEDDFKRTTKTWERDVAFEKKMRERGNGFEAEVFTEDEIYFYLNDGTATRYATMTPNFKPKTQPGKLDSSSGRGGLAFVNTQRPRPGIEARKFNTAIIRKHGKKFVKDIQSASAKGVDLFILRLRTSPSRAINKIRRMF